ncbi:MAG: hypothetical protein ACR2IJ_09240 [Fluviibacter sp.]
MSNNEISYKKNSLNKVNENHKKIQKEFIKLLIGYDIQQEAISFFSNFLTANSVDCLINNQGFKYSQIENLINFKNLSLDDRSKILQMQLRYINEKDDSFLMALKDINTYVEIRFKEFLGE